MKQSLLFDLLASEAARDAGLAAAELSREEILERARAIARVIAQSRCSRCVNADDVYRQLDAEEIPWEKLGPAAGAIFRGKEWEFTGYWEKSERVSNHARAIRVWRLR